MHTLSWKSRGLRTALAFVGTGAYAWSFSRHTNAEIFFHAACAVGVAAAVSWPVFGATLLVAGGKRHSAWDWADVCLIVMSAGIGVMMLGAGVNVAAGPAWSGPAVRTLHLVLLAGGDLLMCALFIHRARRLGMPLVRAVCLWIFVLNGVFVAVLVTMRQLLGGLVS